MVEPRIDLTTRHVRAAIAQSRESVEWIVQRFSPLLEAQARMRLAGTPVGSGDAEDVVAEAWLVMLPRLGEIVPRAGRFTPVLLCFLATTVRALCNRRIENALKRKVDRIDALEERLAGPTSHAVVAHDRQFSDRVRSALDALGEPVRTIVLLRAVEGVENADIAADLGESPNTVSHRYRRGLEKLRAALPDSIFDELLDD